MPEFTVGGTTSKDKTFLEKFLNQPIFGNAGPKILRAAEVIGSPFVDDPHAPAIAEKKVLETIGLAPTIEAKAFLDFMLGSNRKANPSGAERIPGTDPQGKPYPITGVVGEEGKQPEPQVLPMWKADP